jgi:hypothetical protein
MVEYVSRYLDTEIIDAVPLQQMNIAHVLAPSGVANEVAIPVKNKYMSNINSLVEVVGIEPTSEEPTI